MKFKYALKSLLPTLLMLYLVSTAFLVTPLESSWSHRFQISELLFVSAAIVSLLFFRRQLFAIKWGVLDLAVAIYLIINVLSLCFQPTTTALLEVLGRTYLIGVYLLFKVCAQVRLIDEKWVLTGFTYLGFSLVGMAILGYGLLYFGQETSLVIKFEHYPYLGTVYRVRGFLPTPSLYISLVNLCIIYLFYDGLIHSFTRYRLVLLGLLLLSAFLTFSKAILLVAFIVLFLSIRYSKTKHYRKLSVLGYFIIAGGYLLLTNFIFVKDPGNPPSKRYLGVEALPATAQWVPTPYFALKETAVLFFESDPLVGIGPGNFSKRVKAAKAEQHYPAHLPNYDPHSAYFGALAETGILGLLSVIFLLMVALSSIGVIPNEVMKGCLLVWLLLFTIEGFNTDIMNFRHYWIQFGLLAGMMATNQSKSVIS